MSALFCADCCRRVRTREGCPKCPMATVDCVPPLDGWMWFGEGEEKPFSRGRRDRDA